MSNLTIDSEAIRTLVAKSILENIGDEQRDAFIQSAIDNILTVPKSDRYGQRDDSPIESAFKRAVVNVTHTIVADYIQTPDVNAVISGAVEKYVLEKLANESWKADAIGAAVGERIAALLNEN